MDKSWINLPRNTREYEAGLQKFLDFAMEHKSVEGCIICPCRKYGFKKWRPRGEVYDHLICKPFPRGYTYWERHGESLTIESPPSIAMVHSATRTKKNKTYHNEATQIICEKIADAEHGCNTSLVAENDSRAQVLGKEHFGRVQDMGFGVSPTQVFGGSSSHCEDTGNRIQVGGKTMMLVDPEEYCQLKHTVSYQKETLSLVVNCIKEVYASCLDVPPLISQLMSRLDHPLLPLPIAHREFMPNTVSPNVGEDEETQS